MIKPTHDQLKSIVALKGNHHFQRVIDLLGDIGEEAIKLLITAPADTTANSMFIWKGRAATITELLDAITSAADKLEQHENKS